MHFLRSHLPIIALLMLLAPLYLAWSWSGQVGVLGNDGPAYLMMAQHYQPGAVRDPVYTAAAVVSKYPPVYPLALAMLQASELHRAHAVTTVFLLFALLAYYRWLCREGLPRAQAAALVLLFALLPGSWLTGLLIQSEYLYLLLSVLALGAMAAYQRSQNREWLLAAAISVAAACLTRTIGITLFLPLLMVMRAAPRRSALLAMLAAVAPLAIWHLLHRSPQGYSDELQGGYARSGMDMLWRQLATELPALRRGFADNFLLSDPLRPLADGLGVLCLVSVAWRIRGATADGLYVLASLVVLALWPYPDEARRFIWVLLPILLGQLLLTVRSLVVIDLRWQTLPPAVVMIVIALLIAPGLMLMVHRYSAARDSATPEAAHQVLWYASDTAQAEYAVDVQLSMIGTLSHLQDVVPASDCVIATRADIVNYFAHRRTAYPPAPQTPEADFAGQLRGTGCHYVFSIIATDPGGHLSPLYPLTRIPGQFDPVMTCAPVDVMSADPDPPCVLVKLKD
jgi:hypothetical protein